MNGYNVILFSDTTSYPVWMRGYGCYRLASHLKDNGYSCLVLDFSSELSLEYWRKICNSAVGSDTLLIGFSTTWWPYRTPFTNSKRASRFLDFTSTTTVDDVFPNKGLIYDAMTNNLGQWIDIAKNINPNIKTIMGGHKIDDYADAPVDYFMAGLSEVQIIELLDSFKTKKRIWPKVIKHNTAAAGPSWDFKLSQTNYQKTDFIKPNEVMSIEFTRGCRFKCSFCSYPLIGKKDISQYIKDKDVLYKEFMNNYDQWGVTNYWVADDTLNDSTTKLEYIAEVTNKLPFKLSLRAYTRLDVIAINLEQIELLKQIGLYSTWIGVDSFHPVASKAIGKGMPAERRKETLWKMREAWKDDVWVDAGYIVGLPGEDSKSVRDTVDWCTQDNSPITRLHTIPLILNPMSDISPNYNRSDMDLNYQKYGYQIPDMKQPYFWTKDDGTDISSFKQAADLTVELNAKIEKYRLSLKKSFSIDTSGCINDPIKEYYDPLIRLLEQTVDTQ